MTLQTTLKKKKCSRGYRWNWFTPCLSVFIGFFFASASLSFEQAAYGEMSSGDIEPNVYMTQPDASFDRVSDLSSDSAVSGQQQKGWEPELGEAAAKAVSRRMSQASSWTLKRDRLAMDLGVDKIHLEVGGRTIALRLPEVDVSLFSLSNPLVADVAVHKGMIFFTGKSPGMTDLVAFDSKGKKRFSVLMEVRGQRSQYVRIYRGFNRESHFCAPYCEPAIVFGDHPDFTEKSLAASRVISAARNVPSSVVTLEQTDDGPKQNPSQEEQQVLEQGPPGHTVPSRSQVHP